MNWYKIAKSDFYILGKRDSGYLDSPEFTQSLEAIRLKNGDIIYGNTNLGWHLNHWELYYIAKDYIKSTKNIESCGYLDPGGSYTVKISGIYNDIGEYLGYE